MIYSATVVQQGLFPDTWIVTPLYTHVDGQPANDIQALAGNGIVPQVGDMVLCAESINDKDHNSARRFDDNKGANPVIIAVFSQLITTEDDLTIQGNLIVQKNADIQGKATLGQGSKKMVLGDDLQTWAQNVDAAIQALYTWGATGTGASGSIPPFPGSPAYNPWNTATLSQNHTLD